MIEEHEIITRLADIILSDLQAENLSANETRERIDYVLSLPEDYQTTAWIVALDEYLTTRH